MSKYFRISELKDEVITKYEKGISKGEDVGFKCIEDLYSVKLGCTTYVYGSPVSGKSEFWFEVMKNLSKKKGWRHVIWSPETGSASDIAIELMHKWAGKPFYGSLDRDSKSSRLTESEILHLSAELDQYFIIVDAGEYDFTIEEFYSLVDEIEEQVGKIHTTMADPFNEFKHNLQGEARDMYVEYILGKVRKNARNNKRHNCIITHVQDQQLQTASTAEGKDVFYYPMATPRQIAYGQAWYRKGDAMICLWRPPAGLDDKNNNSNRFYEPNEVIIAIQKAKPKGIGHVGIAQIFFDISKSCYYERKNIMNTNEKYYAFQIEEESKPYDNPIARITESALKPSTQFEFNLEEEIEPPF